MTSAAKNLNFRGQSYLLCRKRLRISPFSVAEPLRASPGRRDGVKKPKGGRARVSVKAVAVSAEVRTGAESIRWCSHHLITTEQSTPLCGGACRSRLETHRDTKEVWARAAPSGVVRVRVERKGLALSLRRDSFWCIAWKGVLRLGVSSTG